MAFGLRKISNGVRILGNRLFWGAGRRHNVITNSRLQAKVRWRRIYPSEKLMRLVATFDSYDRIAHCAR